MRSIMVESSFLAFKIAVLIVHSVYTNHVFVGVGYRALKRRKGG